MLSSHLNFLLVLQVHQTRFCRCLPPSHHCRPHPHHLHHHHPLPHQHFFVFSSLPPSSTHSLPIHALPSPSPFHLPQKSLLADRRLVSLILCFWPAVLTTPSSSSFSSWALHPPPLYPPFFSYVSLSPPCLPSFAALSPP